MGARLAKLKINIIAILLTVLFWASFAGCQTAKSDGKSDGVTSIVCTGFPQYDWVKNIIKDCDYGEFEVTFILNNKDIHNFEPSVDDMVRISECDLFIYNGGESDKWVDGVLKNKKNNGMVVLNLTDELGDAAKFEENCDCDNSVNPADCDEYDEHIWLSLNNAKRFCAAIADTLAFIVPEHKSEFNKNLSDYIALLSDLDKRYEEVLRDCPVKTFVFADRFPFRYLFDDYNVDYYAAFPGCSTETAASFEMIISLAEKLDELDSQFVFVTENSDRKIAESAIKASKNKSREILVLDSMQSVLINFGQTDRTYLSYMEKNLSVFLSVITPHEKS